MVLTRNRPSMSMSQRIRGNGNNPTNPPSSLPSPPTPTPATPSPLETGQPTSLSQPLVPPIPPPPPPTLQEVLTKKKWILPSAAALTGAIFLAVHLSGGDGVDPRLRNDPRYKGPPADEGEGLGGEEGEGDYRQENGPNGLPGGPGSELDDIRPFSLSPTRTPSINSVPQPTTLAVLHNVPKIPELIPTHSPDAGSGIISIPTHQVLTDRVGGDDKGSPVTIKWNFPVGSPTPDPAEHPAAPDKGSPVTIKWNFPVGSPTPDPAEHPAAPPVGPDEGSPVTIKWNFPIGSPTPDPAEHPAAGSPVTIKWNYPKGIPTPDPASLPKIPVPFQPEDGSPVTIKWGYEPGAPTPDPAFLPKPPKPPLVDRTGDEDGSSMPIGPDNGSPVNLKWKIPLGYPTPDPATMKDYIGTPSVEATDENGSPVVIQWPGYPTPAPVVAADYNVVSGEASPSRPVEQLVDEDDTPTPAVPDPEVEWNFGGPTTKAPSPYIEGGVNLHDPTTTEDGPGLAQDGGDRSPVTMNWPDDTPTAAPNEVDVEGGRPIEVVPDVATPAPVPAPAEPTDDSRPVELGNPDTPSPTPTPTEAPAEPIVQGGEDIDVTDLYVEGDVPTPLMPLATEVVAPAPTPLDSEVSEPAPAPLPVESVTPPTPLSTEGVEPMPVSTPVEAPEPEEPVAPVPTPVIIYDDWPEEGQPQPEPAAPSPVPPVPAPVPPVPAPVPAPVPQTPAPVPPVPAPVPQTPVPVPAVPQTPQVVVTGGGVPGVVVQPNPPATPQVVTVPQSTPQVIFEPATPQVITDQTTPQTPQVTYVVGRPQVTYVGGGGRPQVVAVNTGGGGGGISYVSQPRPQVVAVNSGGGGGGGGRPQVVAVSTGGGGGGGGGGIQYVSRPLITYNTGGGGGESVVYVSEVQEPQPTIAPTAPPEPHNAKFLGDCDPHACVLNPDADYHAMSYEDEAIYEIYYSNPIKCCRVIVEIGAGDGEQYSTSKFFEDGLNWRSLLIEADPNNSKKAKEKRPKATTVNAAFCESDHITYDDNGNFHAMGGPAEVMSEYHPQVAAPVDHGAQEIPCRNLTTVFDEVGITHIDVMVIRVEGDPLAVLWEMDWTVRVDIWIILLDGSPDPQRDAWVRTMLKGNEYVRAEWAVQRWCGPKAGHCLKNEVFLRKGFNPLPGQVGRALTDSGARRRLSELDDKDDIRPNLRARS